MKKIIYLCDYCQREIKVQDNESYFTISEDGIYYIKDGIGKVMLHQLRLNEGYEYLMFCGFHCLCRYIDSALANSYYQFYEKERRS